MAEPLDASFFTSRGVDAASAASMAHQFNGLSSARPETEPLPPPLPAPPRMAPPVPAPQRLPAPKLQPSSATPASDAQRAQDEMATIQHRRASGEITDYEWRNTYERRYFELAGIAPTMDSFEHGTPADRARMQHEWTTDNLQAQFEQSIDAGMTAPKGEHEYDLGIEAHSPQEQALDADLRGALFSLQLPVAMGNEIAAEMNRTSRQLFDAPPEQIERYMAEQDNIVRRMWGADYDRRAAQVQQLVREAATRSQAVKYWLAENPELFSNWKTLAALARFAESRQRGAVR